MKKKGLFFLLILLIAVSVVMVGCKKEKVVVEEWEIPFLNCLTGAIASIGEYLQWGA